MKYTIGLIYWDEQGRRDSLITTGKHYKTRFGALIGFFKLIVAKIIINSIN